MVTRSNPAEGGLSVSKLAPADAQEARGPEVPGEARHHMIELEAYYLAERRGFCPDCELEDWLMAEAVVDRRLATESAG